MDADELVAQQLGAETPGQLSDVQGQYREAIKQKLAEVGCFRLRRLLAALHACPDGRVGQRAGNGALLHATTCKPAIHELAAATSSSHVSTGPNAACCRLPFPAACGGAAAREGGQGSQV